MQTKFEHKSNRVKGLCFHSERPWILSSLHNGAIQLFDYRNKCLLETFEEHDGPVRGIDFHLSQPLFVSGGDDYKIKVWNYKLKRCLFTLLGHLDYVRTVKFHHTQPWILSASDDQTIRLWNWQSRTLITTLTGHNHYVMSAFFHPQDPLVVSASLDNSVRVWDIGPILKNTPSATSSDLDLSKLNTDFFGSNEVSVKFTLEGHERGVNWANFHPNLPLIVSGADDRQIKIWRMNETNAWEVDTLRGHTNNVSSVAFHPNKDLIISNAEDRSIKVWDTSRRVCLQTFKRENDRFWVLATHPTKNLVAAGHDSGMMVFNLDRERPANFSTNTKTFFVKEKRFIRSYQYSNGNEELVLTLPTVDKTYKSPKFILKNKFDTSQAAKSNGMFLVLYDKKGSGRFQLGSPGERDVFEGDAFDVCFISRSRFAVLEKNSKISIRNMSNETTKRLQPNISSIERIYSTPITGRLLIKASDKIYLYDIQSRKILKEFYVQNVKNVTFEKYITIITKSSIIILDKNMEKLTSIQEPSKIKSVMWNAENTVLLFATLGQVKYLLLNGDNGILLSLSETLYLTKLTENANSHTSTLYCISQECKIVALKVNFAEVLFKLALNSKKFGRAMKIIKTSKLEGKSIINYLYKKNFPQVALHFVEDQKMKFKLAISCSNLKIAMETCLAINEESYYELLAKEALIHGNVSIVEMCYQKTKNFDKLNFLYILTGEQEKLGKMMQIAQNRNDLLQQFNLSLALGKVEEKISVLEKVGQYSLAYVSAKRNGLEERALAIQVKMQELNLKLPDMSKIDGWSSASRSNPCSPTADVTKIKSRNWPLKEVDRGVVYDALVKGVDLMEDKELEDKPGVVSEEERDFSDGEDDIFEDGNDFGDKEEDESEVEEDEADGWGMEASDDEELDFGNELKSPLEENEGFQSPTNGNTDSFQAPSRGIDILSVWQQNSSLAVDHIAAGNFHSAKELLKRQIGAENFAPLLPKMRQIFLACSLAVTAIPNTKSKLSPIIRNSQDLDLSNEENRLRAFANSPFNLDMIQSKVKTAKGYFQSGKFSDALAEFRDILHTLPFVVVKKHESQEIENFLSICREYILGLRLELARKQTNDKARALELALYFANCKLDSKHMILVLNNAMKMAYKLKNFITAANLAKRILAINEFNGPAYAEKKKMAQKLLKKSEMNGTNAVEIEFKKDEDFKVCVVSMTPIYSGDKFVRSPFCKSCAREEYKGQVSPTCEIAILGVQTLGMLNSD